MAGEHVRYAPFYKAIRILTIILVILICVWPFAEARQIQVERTTVTADDLPQSIGQLRIVYLSDIHLSGFPYFSGSQLDSLVRKINGLNPDLVLLGGDYGENAEQTVEFFLKLPSIHSNYGVYAILGECDRRGADAANTSRLRAAMISAGVTPLINTVDTVRIGRSEITLAGLDDVTMGGGVDAITNLARKVTHDSYTIFLSHNPEVITDALTATDSSGRINWYDLGLFGHTHNGQMADILGVIGLKSNARSGWFVENRIPMLVSNGIGTSGLPMRFLCSPTIHVITVKSGK